ncbi:MAG: hypothetical protein H6585_11305 [Flavobacteriales bacterium]|nr:hypothetical protein [Flavobacteriales bacterium]MCB9448922.1 hypothetical protein [Flavobacteriales bacterium]
MAEKLIQSRALQVFQVVRYGALLLSGVLLARSPWAPESLSSYEQVLFFASAITFFWVNGMVQTLLGHANEVNRHGKSRLFFQVFLVLQATALVAALIVWSYLRHGAGNLPQLGPWVALYICIGVPAFLNEYMYLLLGKGWQMIAYGIASALIQIIMVVIPAWMGMPFTYSLYGLLLAAVCRYTWLWVLLGRYAQFRYDYSFLPAFVKMSAPLGIAALVAGMGEYIDGWLVTEYMAKESFAVFRYGAREFPVALLLASALSQSMIANFAVKGEEETLQAIKLRSVRLMHIVFPSAILLMLTSHWLFPFVFGERFGASADVFNVYLLITVSRLTFPQVVVIGRRKHKIIPKVALIEIILNVGISLMLMPTWGMAGIAWGTVIAYSAEKMILILYNHYRLNIFFASYTAVGKLAIYTFVLLISYFAGIYIG